MWNDWLSLQSLASRDANVEWSIVMLSIPILKETKSWICAMFHENAKCLSRELKSCAED